MRDKQNISFEDKAWAAMQAQLDQEMPIEKAKKRRLAAWWWPTFGIAASLLVVGGLWWLAPNKDSIQATNAMQLTETTEKNFIQAPMSDLNVENDTPDIEIPQNKTVDAKAPLHTSSKHSIVRNHENNITTTKNNNFVAKSTTVLASEEVSASLPIFAQQSDLASFIPANEQRNYSKIQQLPTIQPKALEAHPQKLPHIQPVTTPINAATFTYLQGYAGDGWATTIGIGKQFGAGKIKFIAGIETYFEHLPVNASPKNDFLVTNIDPNNNDYQVENVFESKSAGSPYVNNIIGITLPIGIQYQLHPQWFLLATVAPGTSILSFKKYPEANPELEMPSTGGTNAFSNAEALQPRAFRLGSTFMAGYRFNEKFAIRIGYNNQWVPSSKANSQNLYTRGFAMGLVKSW